MDKEKVIKEWETVLSRDPLDVRWDLIDETLALLKEQEDNYKNILSDYEDLAREHEKLLDKKIPLITNGQEVIRCKDCKFWDAEEHDCNIKIGWFACGADWYCADGERKSADEKLMEEMDADPLG